MLGSSECPKLKIVCLVEVQMLEELLRLYFNPKVDFWSWINHYLIEGSMGNHNKLRWSPEATKTTVQRSHKANDALFTELPIQVLSKLYIIFRMEKTDITEAMRKINNLLFHPMEENKKNKVENGSYLLVLVYVWSCSFIYLTKMYRAATTPTLF